MRFCLSGCLWSTKISISFIFSPKIMPWLPPGVHISRVHSRAFPHSFPYNKAGRHFYLQPRGEQWKLSMQPVEASLVAQLVKNPPALQETACNAGDLGSIHGLGRSSGEGNGNPLQFSCLGSPMDSGDCQVTGHGVTRVGHHWATEPPPPSFNQLERKELKKRYINKLVRRRSEPGIFGFMDQPTPEGALLRLSNPKQAQWWGDACVWSQCHPHPSKNTCGDRESYLSECNLLLGAPRASTPCLLCLFLFLLFWAPKLSLLWHLVTFDSHLHVTFRLLLP